MKLNKVPKPVFAKAHEHRDNALYEEYKKKYHKTNWVIVPEITLNRILF